MATLHVLEGKMDTILNALTQVAPPASHASSSGTATLTPAPVASVSSGSACTSFSPPLASVAEPSSSAPSLDDDEDVLVLLSFSLRLMNVVSPGVC